MLGDLNIVPTFVVLHPRVQTRVDDESRRQATTCSHVFMLFSSGWNQRRERVCQCVGRSVRRKTDRKEGADAAAMPADLGATVAQATLPNCLRLFLLFHPRPFDVRQLDTLQTYFLFELVRPFLYPVETATSVCVGNSIITFQSAGILKAGMFMLLIVRIRGCKFLLYSQ